MKDLLPQMFLSYPAIWQMNLVQPQHHIRTLTFKSLSSLWDLGKCKERVCIDGSKYIWQFSCTNCHIGKMPYTFWLWQFSPMGIFLGIAGSCELNCYPGQICVCRQPSCPLLISSSAVLNLHQPVADILSHLSSGILYHGKYSPLLFWDT